jgi:hypothetical protein
MLLPSSRTAVAFALAEPLPAPALVQLMQVSMIAALTALAVAKLGGAGVNPLVSSAGVLFRVVGVLSCLWGEFGWYSLWRGSARIASCGWYPTGAALLGAAGCC